MRSGNRLIDATPLGERVALHGDLEIVVLQAHRTTHSVGEAIRFVDFPIDAVLSVVTRFQSGETIEVGTVGNESFVETDAVLRHPIASRSSFCQVAGRVGRMPVETFQDCMARDGPFAERMRDNVRATLFATQQLAACNMRHTAVERCARWLAMTADRVGRPEFVLSHDFLGIMLGLPRGGADDAADRLEDAGAIAYHAGLVTIVDAELLRRYACECYAVCNAAFAEALVR